MTAKGAKIVLNELRRRYKAEEPGLTKTELASLSGIPLPDIDEAVNKYERQGRLAVDAVLNESGSVSPTVRVDKMVSDQVICEGASPFVIKDQFIINDGTFNCNGRNIQVGL